MDEIGGELGEIGLKEKNPKNPSSVADTCTWSTDLWSCRLATLIFQKNQVPVKDFEKTQSNVPGRPTPVPGRPDTQEAQEITGPEISSQTQILECAVDRTLCSIDWIQRSF